MRLEWTTPALRDLEAIGDYIAQHDPVAAGRVVNAVFAQTEKLIVHPQIGRPGRVAGTRELIIVSTPFVVPYRLKLDRVEVIAVFHGARRWPESFD